MKMNEFQKLSKRTMPKRSENEQENFNAVANYALGLVSEAGEVGDLIKKELFHGHEIEQDEIKKELGDVLHYLAGLAFMYGLTLEGIAEANIEKLKRRYPEGFSEHASINRKE